MKPTIEERRAAALAAIEEHIQEVVAAAPPLSPEQIARLRELFRSARAVSDGSEGSPSL